MDELTEIFTRDVPRGALISDAREHVLPGRTWVGLGDVDGTEIYLDADENVRVLVRTVRSGAQDVAGEPTVVRARSVIEVRSLLD